MFNEHFPDFLRKDATNIYRTKNYIVVQCMSIDCENGSSTSISKDTYYLRTLKRDSIYDKVFSKREHINGKRLASMMYSRKYIA